MGYIFSKLFGYIFNKLWDIFQFLGRFWAIMFPVNYGTYFFCKLWDIFCKLWDIYILQTMGYIINFLGGGFWLYFQ